MKKKVLIVLFVLLCIPITVLANNSSYELIAETTKYYRIETSIENNGKTNSIAYEISKEEYENADIVENVKGPGNVETTYKSMTTTITSYGNYYRYKNILSWKIIPSTRSYDIIGIGFLSTVKVHNNTTHFEQYYCYTNGGCNTTTTNYPQIFSNGAGTSFALPSGDLRVLKQTFYFDVEKNTNNTITSQSAYGDYSHATSSISLFNSTLYSVNSYGGIVLDSSITGYYDSIDEAEATWTGSW